MSILAGIDLHSGHIFAEGSEPLVCLIVGQRLAQDVADYPNLKKRLYRNDGEWNLVDHSNIQHIKR